MQKWLLFFTLVILSVFSFAAPPSADKVFHADVKVIDPNTLTINWQINPGYFLYSDRIKLEEVKDSNVRLGQILYPKPKIKTDKRGTQYGIYRNSLNLPVAILGEEPGETWIILHYQGCADDGYCYPPQTQKIKLTVNDNLALTAAKLENVTETKHPTQLTPSTLINYEESIFATEHWIVVILSFFGFGLLLSFTPCVLPMIPVLSGIIVGHGDALTTRKAFLLSLSYVLSMAITYAVIGAVVALLGSNLQVFMQSTIIIVLFSLLFVLLSLSMFGFYDLKMPVSWQAKLAKLSRNQANGHYLGAAIMGCLSTLILSPCVTAPLLGVLSYIAQNGNIFFGLITLFSLGLGMGAPLLLIGISAGKWLPKAGIWMNKVKSFFGILLVAVAIYLLERVFPKPLIMTFWAALLVFLGIYLGAFKSTQSNQEKFSQGLGILSFVYGLLVLIGASMGETNPLQPLSGLHSTPTTEYAIKTNQVATLIDLQNAINNAQGKPVMVDFYADWCVSCQVIEATTLKDPNIQNELKNFLILKVDITANNSEDKALMSKFQVVAPPTFIFFNQEGKELTNYRLVGEVSTQAFLERLKQVLRARMQ